jgi:bifunctional enzyme CysN/CysC
MEDHKSESKILSPCTLWLTGLSGAGKTTIAEQLKSRIDKMIGTTSQTFILDGDVIRRGLNKDLGFTADDRAENIRRIAEVSSLLLYILNMLYLIYTFILHTN